MSHQTAPKPGKQYGLIIPGKQAAKPVLDTGIRKKPSIFNQSDSDSDNSGTILPI